MHTISKAINIQKLTDRLSEKNVKVKEKFKRLASRVRKITIYYNKIASKKIRQYKKYIYSTNYSMITQ